MCFGFLTNLFTELTVHTYNVFTHLKLRYVANGMGSTHIQADVYLKHEVPHCTVFLKSKLPHIIYHVMFIHFNAKACTCHDEGGYE